MPDLLSFLGEVALRSSLVLTTVFTLLLVLKRASASQRHVVLVLGLLMTALVPGGLLLSPKMTWTISVPHQVESRLPTQKTAYLPLGQSTPPPISSSVVKNGQSFRDALTFSNGLSAFLAAGMLVQVVLLGRAVRAWRRIGHRAVKALLPDDVLEKAQVFAGVKTLPPILVSDQITVPLLTGWLQPAIILPTEANHWPSQRLLMAVCHELAHFRRGDSQLLPLICLLRVLYWWHPLVWLALARLRRERENACDDLVLNQNFRATDYADLIVEAARRAHEFRWQNGALAMASTSNVGERVGAILNPELNRRPASRTTVFTGLILAFALGWLFVAAQVQAQDTPAASDSTTATDASKPQIQLEFKLLQIDEKTYLSHQKDIDAAVANLNLVSLINLVNNLPGASLLSAPSVTTQDGLKAEVDIGREMPYATKFGKDNNGKIVPSEFKTRKLGLSIVALPTLTADGKNIDLFFHLQVSSFEGFEDISPGIKQPVFDQVSSTTKVLMGKHGYVAWIGGPGLTRTYMPGQGEVSAPLAKSIIPKRILLLINAHPLPAEAQAASVPSNAMVEIKLKLFKLSEKTYAQQTASVADALAMTDALNRGDISYFSRFSDFDLLAEPAVLIKIGERGTLEAVKKMSYPVKFVLDSTGKFIPSDTVKDRLVGMRFVMRPELLADGTISLSCFDEITTYEGMIDYGYMVSAGSNEKQPVFNTSRMNGKYALVAGKPFGAWVRTNFEDQSKVMSWKTGDPPVPPSPNTPRVRIAMVMTARLYSADGVPIPAH